jgi:hypothetical protein
MVNGVLVSYVTGYWHRNVRVMKTTAVTIHQKILMTPIFDSTLQTDRYKFTDIMII